PPSQLERLLLRLFRRGRAVGGEQDGSRSAHLVPPCIGHGNSVRTSRAARIRGEAVTSCGKAAPRGRHSSRLRSFCIRGRDAVYAWLMDTLSIKEERL